MVYNFIGKGCDWFGCINQYDALIYFSIIKIVLTDDFKMTEVFVMFCSGAVFFDTL